MSDAGSNTEQDTEMNTVPNAVTKTEKDTASNAVQGIEIITEPDNQSNLGPNAQSTILKIMICITVTMTAYMITMDSPGMSLKTVRLNWKLNFCNMAF